jgi:hemin uptake protein HemP
MTDDENSGERLRLPTPAAKQDAERIQTPRRIASRDLFAGRRELVIVHDGRHYHLRITQNGKLILTA